MRIVIGSDHAGFLLKGLVIQHLQHDGHDVTDVGTHSEVSVDYPPICADVARRVVHGDGSGGGSSEQTSERSRERGVGIVIGGSGQGEAMAANKVHGARAALCHDEYSARLARRHNDANILSLGARVVATELALDIIEVFLETPFDGGRHVARIEELASIEAEEARDGGLEGVSPEGTAPT